MMNLNDVDLIISEKLDGISIDVSYVDGKISEAITRGDGTTGENILKNVIRMKNVKKELPIPFTGSLRGEILLKKEDLKSVNFICRNRKENEFQNVRNGACGIARRFDGKYSEYLFILYYDATVEFETKKDVFDFIKNELKIEVCKHYVGNIETAKIVYNEYEESIRAELEYEIDGLVVSLNDLKLSEKLGLKNNNPVGSIAWKFNTKKAKTRIKDVEWQIGDTNRLTPIVVFETVEINGVHISRASLHNYKNFLKMKPYKGAVCIISRRNDVIPFCEEIFPAR